ncbi:MAG: hemerythrin domain-containing protein [Leptospiraceae bacterium]|nr:hemerythrin domain-containing protein [Leptospiraceae bacterium]
MGLPYIEKLKTEHTRLQTELKNLLTVDISQPHGKQELFRVMDALSVHMQVEDNGLYATLRKAARTDPEIATTLEHFARDIQTLGADTVAFFDRYRSHGDPISFRAELQTLYDRFLSRVRKEELVLFELYSQIQARLDPA